MNSKRIRQYSLLILVVLLVLIFFLPFKIPYTSRTIARVYPQQEWKLSRDNNGNIYSAIKNNKNSLINDFTNYEFERGDISNIHINLNSNNVKKGDTIAVITSVILAEQIAELEGEVMVEEAMLAAAGTGLKAEDVNIIKSKLALAQQEFNQANINYTRISLLHAKNAVSDEVFETAQNTLKTKEINITIFQRKLEAATKGEKQEDINLIKMRINTLKQQAEFIKSRQLNYSIISPISGIVQNYNTEENLLSISDISSVLIKTAVKASFSEFIDNNSHFELSLTRSDTTILINNIINKEPLSIIDNQQVVIINSVINNNQEKLVPGMTIECKVVCEPITISEYFKRSIKFVF